VNDLRSQGKAEQEEYAAHSQIDGGGVEN